MTMQDDDDRIDAMVRAASAYPVDEARLTRAVLTRVRDANAGVFGLFGRHARGAALAFASVLVATPILMTQVPSEAEDAVIAALLLGESLVNDATVDALLTGETVE
jgi:hypothetical protein